MGFGIWQLILILAVVLVIFGSGKLPGAIKDIGKGLRSLKDGDEDKKSSDAAEKAIIVNKDDKTDKEDKS